MATEKQIGAALTRKLLGRPNYEDPNRCEFHAYILQKLDRWSAPTTARGWKPKASRLRRRLLDDVYLRGAKSFADGPLKTEWGKTIRTGNGYRTRKVR